MQNRDSATMLRAGVALLVIGALVACGSTGKAEGESYPEATPADNAELAELRSRVESLLAEPTCSKNDECRALPLGSKPCGGPRSWLIYSTATADSAALEEATSAYAKADD